MGKMNYSRSAFVFNNIKSSALYYDRVVPINVAEFSDYPRKPISETYTQEEYPEDVAASVWRGLSKNKKTVKNLLFGDSSITDSGLQKALELIEEKTLIIKKNFFNPDNVAFFNAQHALPAYHNEQQGWLARSIVMGEATCIGSNPITEFQELTEAFSLKDPSFIMPRWHGYECTEGHETVLYEVVFKSSAVIDPRYLGWDQIIDIRKDNNAINAIARFRNFLHNEYSGKDENYISDNIAVKFDDYRYALKKHGIATKAGWFSALGTLNTNALSISAAIASINGNSIAALVTAGLAAVSASFEVKKLRREYDQIVRQFPMSFIDPIKFNAKDSAILGVEDYSAYEANRLIEKVGSLRTNLEQDSIFNPEQKLHRWIPGFTASVIKLDDGPQT